MSDQTKERKIFFLLICLLVANLFLYLPVGQAAENDPLVLKEGTKSDDVVELQMKLKKLGFLSVAATGYFGSLTTQAVKDFQLSRGLAADGVAGPSTLRKLSKSDNTSHKTKQKKKVVQRSGQRVGEIIPWFGAGERIFPRGGNALVTDVETGLSFWVKRTQGTNHADCEPLSYQDTATMRNIYGGSWSWDRRAVILTIGGQRIAASMNGMPHGNTYINGNGMDGHFCIHLYGSLTHGSHSVDSGHQSMIRKAAGYR